MDWVVLLVAGLFETVWAGSLKASHGFTRFWPSALTVAAMAVSLYLLAVALRTLPLGTAYTVWTGVGAVGAVFAGVALFGERLDLARGVCVGLIVAGIVGLRVFSPR